MESIMVFGVTPLALCGSAQVLMVLISAAHANDEKVRTHL